MVAATLRRTVVFIPGSVTTWRNRQQATAPSFSV